MFSKKPACEVHCNYYIVLCEMSACMQSDAANAYSIEKRCNNQTMF